MLTYTSGPLASAVEIIGPVTAELHVTSSLEHTDFFARLCDVHPRGAHPRYARNPGTGEPLATATTLRAAEQTVHHDPQHASGILLPVVTAG